MEASINTHIQHQPAERQSILTAIHNIILKNDPSVGAVVGSMMGKEMLLYNDRGHFKYGLASGKAHLSLHCLPIYMNATLYDKYVALFPRAKVQKGCINFKNEEEAPLDVVGSLISDCAPIDLIAMRQQQLDAKKKK